MRIKKIVIFFIPIFLILYFWKNTILHATTHLYDWHDVPFVIWVFQNNIKHIGAFDFAYHNETNAMFPFPFSLSFTEHMYFPSLLIYLFSFFTSNAILQFNILAVLNHLMIYVSAYLFVGRFVKNNWTKVLSAFFIAFSPYFFTQLGHFQMLVFWPLLISLYFLLHPNRQIHHFIVAGIFLAWQFMSSMYIGAMGGVIIVMYYVLRLLLPGFFSFVTLSKRELENKWKAFLLSYHSPLDDKKPQDIIRLLAELGVLFVVFIILVEPTLEAYFQMQSTYKPTIEQGQYVTYAAHITDYLFPSGQNSLLYHLFSFWKVLDHHFFGEKAAFIGFIPLGIIGYWALKLRGKVTKDVKWALVWSILLIVVGFVCSLGPRFNLNGNYLVFPLPYYAVLKTVPFIGFMRALARWYLVVTVGFGVLFALGLDSIFPTIKKGLIKTLFFPAIFCLLIFEFYPSPLPATQLNWWTKGYEATKRICTNLPSPMLEYPFDYRAKDTSVSKDLSYKNTILLASTLHNCEILSGFSAFQPKKYIEYRDFLQNHDFNRGALKLLTDLDFKYVKFNYYAMNEAEKKQIQYFLTYPYTKKLYEDNNTAIIQIRKLTKYELIEE